MNNERSVLLLTSTLSLPLSYSGGKPVDMLEVLA